MGCGNIKEKLEDEIMKAKLARIEVQYERQKQMELLKEIDGKDYKPPIIPDYLTPTSIKKQPTIRKKSSHSISKFRKSKILKLKPKRNKSTQILVDRISTNSDKKNI